MNERRKIARAIAEVIEEPLMNMGAGTKDVEFLVDEATTSVMAELSFEDEE